MWVKICANTRLDDALAAVEAGADAVGFVFAQSKRRVDAATVRKIVAGLPGSVETVGVFAGFDADAIVTAVRESGLTTVQLHGGVDLALAGPLKKRLGDGIGLIHTVHWIAGEDDVSADVVREQLGLLDAGERVLIDARVGDTSGGLGVSFDWARAATVLAEFPALRVIVAGGLRSDNVAEAVRVFAPYGVDVASGVERLPGQKDHGKVRTFIENARRA
jgi:phosphoribosylanthranilate isomerase